MQRLVEQPTEDGDVFEGPVCIGRVHYHLSVCQHFAEDGKSVPAQLNVEGRLMPFVRLDLSTSTTAEVVTKWAAFGRLDAGAIEDRWVA
jgi:hypothetical protein